jgi:hypothetical protein
LTCWMRTSVGEFEGRGPGRNGLIGCFVCFWSIALVLYIVHASICIPSIYSDSHASVAFRLILHQVQYWLLVNLEVLETVVQRVNKINQLVRD